MSRIIFCSFALFHLEYTCFMLRRKASHLLLILFLVFSCFLMSAKPARAGVVSDWLSSVFHIKEATTSYSNALLEEGVAQEKNVSSTWANSFNYINGNVYGGETMAKLGGITGKDKIALEESLGDGMLGDVNKGIVALYTPPASTKTYVADVMKSAKIIPEAQAQGLGFAALDPILETWKSFRNLAYLFFVLIFLIIGFMIMFRTKVGQAAITAQQAIPSVIIAMLAVTFSYAIAGFMIDIMYVVMYMIAGFFTEGSDIVTRNIFGLVGLMFKGTTGSTQNAIEQFMEDALNIGLVGEAIAWMSSLLGTVIVGIAILFATFKVFFELVKTYVAVIIQIIFSPIILMLGAFPGKNVFGKWLKDLTGNLILWPVVLVCILVQRMLTAPIRNLQGTGETLDSSFGGGFMPPFLVGQGQASIIPVILGIGILLVIPEIMQQVKKAMGVDEGIFGQLAKSALNQTKEALPLGGRLASLGIGGAAAAGQTAANIPRALAGDPKNIGRNLIKGVPKAFVGGTRAGFSATHKLSKSVGANQPDIVNLITNPMDDVFLNEDLQKERSMLQLGEDINQRIAPHQGASLIPKKWTQKLRAKADSAK